MKSDTVKLVFTQLDAILILVGGFYALVIYPYQLDDLVKGAVIALMTLAANHVFADSAATRVGRQQESAFSQGVTAAPFSNGNGGTAPG